MPAVDRARIARALPRYALGEQLGAGSFGLVIAGRHLDLDRLVAIKVLPAASVSGFRGEARMLSRLDHPHIVRVHDYVVLDDLCLMVMELLSGGALSQHQLSAAGTLAVGAAVADALAHAHAAGVLHRDIKPDNILFTGSGQPKLTDFGIGMMLDGAPGPTGQVVGTPRYMAPEQIAGGPVGPPADLYALGVVLYELVSGRQVFDPGLSVPELLRHQREVDPPVPAGVPAAVCDVVLRTLAKDPAARPADARTLARDLAAAAAAVFGPDWPAGSGLVVHLPESTARPPAPGEGPVPRFTPPPRPSVGLAGSAGEAAEARPRPPSRPESGQVPGHEVSGHEVSGREVSGPQPVVAARNLFEGTSYGGWSPARRRTAVVAGAVAAFLLAVVALVLMRELGDGGGTGAAAADGGSTGTPTAPAAGTAAPPLIDTVRAWALAPSGGFYIVDGTGARLLRLALDGTVSVVAGTGVEGSTGDGGPATAARLRGVNDLAVAPDGTVLLSDGGNQRIRRIGVDGVIRTVAGGGSELPADGRRATDVSLGSGGRVACGPGGELVLARAGQIYRVDRAGVLHLIARTQDVGATDNPARGEESVPVIAASIGDLEVGGGRVYVADFTTDRIRVLEPDGTPRTLAGGGPQGQLGDGGPATAAGLNLSSEPSTLALDPTGNLYFAEPVPNRVRRVDARGVITTVAGTGEIGSGGNGGPATAARLWSPARVALDTSGVLFIGETGTSIRRVGPDGVITSVLD
ncbi:serine/threonine protein kinase [Frankia sp. EI5c]|uniref:serine/threonine-protein kinase n=1 Tax=Frankia sp. EI5c TaxID=683316 RepID=UPI0007C3614B|nr:serine/threonine-protein kinase [Frankia sp. EI5c]OAA29056.1 serine/threonine protein kinase [Frankia sp. EI5c]